MKAELEKLMKKREELQEIRKRAVEAGDVSENDELDMAEEAIIVNDEQIHNLEEQIKNAVIVSGKDSEGVGIGNTVTVNVNGKQQIFEIVALRDANPVENKISLQSPIGAALAGHKKGDKISVDLPRGTVTYEIVDVK